MKTLKTRILAFSLSVGVVTALQTLAAAPPPPWRIIIANDTCPDVTWGFPETQVRQAFADLIAAHLDEMTRTDAMPKADRDHYNATAFIEVEAFWEKYPLRRAELLRRVREGGICVSPFLCNSLWGFQSVEGALRTFYPARRLEREHGVPIDIAEHIELPSLPWGMATLMAGCGIRWTSVPFMDYDTTFRGLNNPPLFRLKGPDGSEVRVRLDAWASMKTSYYQGDYLLKDPKRVESEWIPHYAGLGATYPLRTIFASGTHSDINPLVPAFGFREYTLETNADSPTAPLFNATATTLEGPFYRLRVDPANGGLASLVHKASGQEIVNGNWGRSLCQTVFNDGKERLFTDGECQAHLGPVCAEMHVTGRIGDLYVTNIITFYAELDRVDFDVRLAKPISTNEQRLLHFFPIGDGVRDLRIETTAAVVRPQLRPDGDLLPGADPRRFAVQGFVDCSPPGHIGVIIAPLDAFLLRLDQGGLAFEALGNDQNWKEVTQDQAGETQFRFRYSLQAHQPGYQNAAAFAWSRSAAAPLTLALGRLPKNWLGRSFLAVDPSQALVTCMKSADNGAVDQTMVRVWETGGKTGVVEIAAPGYRTARRTDLLEREGEALPVKQGKVALNARGYGFSGLELIR